jgi:EmrB/QacA subfamily drug resistance transporter
MHQSAHPASDRVRSRWWPLVAVCLGTFILLVDVTIVSVALPQMARDLHAQLDSLQWVVDAYALSLAALLLVCGSLADRFGRRRLFQLGLILFALSSLACALAPNAGFLIAARTVQGAGAAAMFATNTALLNNSYEGRDRSVAFGIWGAINGAAAAVAPVLGGLLIAAANWRAIFLVNLPIAVVAGIMTQRTLAESRGHASPIDWAGASSFTVAAAALTYALIHGGDSGWGTPVTLASFAVSAVALLIFPAIELRVAYPVLDLGLFRRASFTMLMIVGVVMTGCAFAPFLYTQLWLQSVLGLPAIGAGLVLLPSAGTAFVVSAVAGRYLHGIAPRWPLGAGLVLIGAGSLLRTVLTASSGWASLIAGLVVTGIGVGLAAPVLISATLAAVPRPRSGMASGAVNTFRQIGYALGIAAFGSLFAARVGHLGAGATSHTVRAAYATAQNDIYLVAGLTAIACGLVAMALIRPQRDPGPAPSAPSATAPSATAQADTAQADTAQAAAAPTMTTISTGKVG